MASLQVEATLRDKTKAGITKLQRQIEIAHTRANTLRNKERAAVEKAHLRATRMREQEKAQLDRNTRRMGMYGAAVAGVVVGLGAKAVNAFQNFQASMNKVRAVTEASADEMLRLKDIALEMGSSTQFSAKEAADAMGFLAMAGLSVNEVAEALPGTLELAAAGNLKLAQAADIATNVMSGMGLEVSELGRLNDVLATAAASSNTTVKQLGSAMKFVGPVASAAGMSVEEAAAAIGVLSNAGIQGEMAGTALRGAISKLLNPTKDAEKAIDRLGVSVTDSTGAMRPFDEIVGQFEESGLSAADAMKIFGQRAGPGMLALVSAGSKGLTDYTRELENAEGAAAAMAETQMEGLVGSMTELSSAVDTLMIRFGERLAPTVGMLVDRFVGFVSWLTESEKRIDMVAGILAGAFVAGVGLAVAAVWTFVPAITAATGGLNLVIPLIALVVGGLVTWREEIGAFLSGAWAALKSAIGGALSWMSPLLRVFGHTTEEVAKLADELAGHSLTTALADVEKAAEATRLEQARLNAVQEAALRVTEVQWASYQKLWEIGTPLTNMLSSNSDAFRDLAGVVPGVTSEFSGLSDAVEEQESTWASFGEQVMGALRQALGAVGGFVLDTVKAFAAGGPIAGAIAATMAAFNWFVSSVDEWLNGAAMAFNDASDSITGALSRVIDGSLTAAEAFDRAFNWTGNEAAFDRLKMLQDLWVEAGLTAEAATAWQVRYNEAVAAQDHASIQQLLGELEDVGEAARLAGEAQVEAARLASEAQARLDNAISATMSAYFRAKDAGVAAYDRVYEAAIESGANQEQATARAEDAQLKAAAKILREERKKFVQLARFEAILAAIRSGNAEGAVAAGNKAAREVRQAWDLSIGQVGLADDLATGKKNVNAVLAANVAIDESNRSAQAVIGDINSIPTSRTVRIEYHGVQTGTHGDFDIDIDPSLEFRQHGGPVSAGRPYMVGEAGPELFVPNRSGSVVANQDQQRPVVIRNVIPIDDITEQVIRRTADKEAEIGFDV